MYPCISSPIPLSFCATNQPSNGAMEQSKEYYCQNDAQLPHSIRAIRLRKHWKVVCLRSSIPLFKNQCTIFIRDRKNAHEKGLLGGGITNLDAKPFDMLKNKLYCIDTSRSRDARKQRLSTNNASGSVRILPSIPVVW